MAFTGRRGWLGAAERDDGAELEGSGEIRDRETCRVGGAGIFIAGTGEGSECCGCGGQRWGCMGTCWGPPVGIIWRDCVSGLMAREGVAKGAALYPDALLRPPSNARLLYEDAYILGCYFEAVYNCFLCSNAASELVMGNRPQRLIGIRLRNYGADVAPVELVAAYNRIFTGKFYNSQISYKSPGKPNRTVGGENIS